MKFGTYFALCVISGLSPLSIILLAAASTDFTPFSDYISEIGVGDLAVLFNTSLILSAIFVVPIILKSYGRYGYYTILFLVAALSLALVGIFPLTSEFHNTVAGTFFVLAFTSVFFAGLRMSGWKKRLSVALAMLCALGLIFFNPFIETLQVFGVAIWIITVGILGAKNNLY